MRIDPVPCKRGLRHPVECVFLPMSFVHHANRYCSCIAGHAATFCNEKKFNIFGAGSFDFSRMLTQRAAVLY